MARVRDYRGLTGIPTVAAQDGGLARYQLYTQASGIHLAMNTTGTVFTIGLQVTGTASMMTNTPTGRQGAGTMTLPNDWIQCYGPSGQFFLIPVYLASTGLISNTLVTNFP